MSLELDGCCIDRHQITDKSSIERILKYYSLLKDGWRTAEYLALTRGWFTSPSFGNRALFQDERGKTIDVLWFGDGLIGTRAVPPISKSNAYREPSPALLATLRNAPRDAIESIGGGKTEKPDENGTTVPPIKPSNLPLEPVAVYLLPLDDFPFNYASELARTLSDDLKINVRASLPMGQATFHRLATELNTQQKILLRVHTR